MKALSLLQPWATLLVKNIKRVETRSWSTKHKGRLYIHASQKYTPAQASIHKSFADQGFFDMEEKIWVQGSIIGYVDLIGCVKAADYKRMCEARIDPCTPEDWKREAILGNLTLNGTRIAWICKNPVMFKEPIPCKGALSIWTIPTDIQEQIKLQL